MQTGHDAMVCSDATPGTARARVPGSRRPGVSGEYDYGQYAGWTLLDVTDPAPLDGPADKVMKAAPKYQWLTLHAIPGMAASGT
jgi:hypothetical protein